MTLILLLGADIKLAGSLSLAVSLPMLLVGFTRTAAIKAADSDEVARAFRDDVARCSDMMSPGVRYLAG